MRRFAVFAMSSLTLLSLRGCSPSASTVDVSWHEVPARSLVPGTGSRPFAAAVSAGGDGRPASIGGVILGSPASPGFFPVSSRQVAFWVAPNLKGPWSPASMNAIQGRDGPDETMMYIAANRTSAAAFGWRNSPTEGYPRPSVWLAADASERTWNEILEPREFFGGPNVVSYGGMSGGPNGFFIAGTWTDNLNHPAVCVWHSRGGVRWAQDIVQPGVQPDAGATAFGQGVADGAHGVLLIGNLEVPTSQDPGARAGALWYSATGDRWAHVYSDPSSSSTFDAVAATSGGWVVAGTDATSGSRRPAVWFVPASLRRQRPVELPVGPVTQPVLITSMSGTASHLVVAGTAGGKALLWAARIRNGVPASWERLAAPPAAQPGLLRVAVSTGTDGTIVVLIGNQGSRVWTTSWH